MNHFIDDRHADVVRAIGQLTLDRGIPPTMRDIMAYLDYSSPNSIVVMLARLRSSGFVLYEERKARTIRLSEKAIKLLERKETNGKL